MKVHTKISTFVLIAFSITLFSCQPQHCALTHSTPHFSEKRHAEANASLDVFNGGGAANIAVSPLKYFAVQANGYLYPGIQSQSTYYSKCYEVGAGFYYPIGKSLLALNAGYGYGTYNWQLTSFTGYSGYTLNEARFDSKKYFVQAYWSFKNNNEEKIYKGFSAKLSSYQTTYYSGSAEAGNFSLKYMNANKQSYSVELIAFYKMQLYKAFYIDFNAGIMAAKEDAALVGRIGLALRL